MISRILSIFSCFSRKTSPQISAGARLYADLIDPERLAAMLGRAANRIPLLAAFETLALATAIKSPSWAGEHDTSLALVGFINALVADIDMSFRERSLGDATVKKHATNHAAAFYGRLQAYGQDMDEKTLRRNLFAGAPTDTQAAALPHIISDLKQALHD